MGYGFRKFLLSALLVTMLLATGIAIAAWLNATKPDPGRTAKSETVPLVRIHPVISSDVTRRFVGYGSARPDTDALLAAELSGAIVEIAPRLNDAVAVNAGQLLLRIDDRRYQQQLKRAQAIVAGLTAQGRLLEVEKTNINRLAAIARQGVDVNREEMRRLTRLYEKELASQKEVDFAHLAYQRSRRDLQTLENQLELIPTRNNVIDAKRAAARADAEIARLDVERCRITAPFTGIVDRLNVSLGDHVLPGTRILRLIDLNLIEIPIQLPSSIRRYVYPGMPCQLKADTMPGVVWQGTIARVGPAADVRTRTFPAYVEVNNQEQTTPLTPGAFLTAYIQGPTLRDVIAVPRGAIIRTPTRDKNPRGATRGRSGLLSSDRAGHDGTVFVVNDHRAHTRDIRVEQYIRDQAIITGDLHPGDKLIVSNLDMLTDGKTVRVQPPKDHPGAPGQPIGVPESVGYSDSVPANQSPNDS